MSASLVGSEMCIRDRQGPLEKSPPTARLRACTQGHRPAPPPRAQREAVSYTHLTLPTICSV
eukprot:3568243-Alexandrium_andersonii.AAC.1